MPRTGWKPYPGYNSNASRTNRRSAVRAAGTHFVAVDGEGWTDALGHHRYAQLSVGERTLFGWEHLSFLDILDFLWECHQDHPRAAYVGFFLSYDFSQWLRTLPSERAWRLMAKDGIASRRRDNSGGNTIPFPVEYGGYLFDMLGDKRFKLRKVGAPDDMTWMNICDTGPFFQASFLSVINPKAWPDGPICTQEEYDIILEGKSHRADDWTRETWLAAEADLTRYNVAENIVLSKVMTRVEEGLRSLGVRLNRDSWYGPGAAAAKWMDVKGVVLADHVRMNVPEHVLDFARESYYGGWFEVFAHGIIPGESWEADITSAYPHAMSEMPAFEDMEYIESGDYWDGSPLALVDVTTHSADEVVGSMLHRTPQGSILRPRSTRGVRWGFELLAAEKAGLLDSFEVHRAVLIRGDTRSVMTGEVPALFQHRKEVGKNTAAGKAAKLLLNSLYGKQAQSIGSPKFSNSLAASFITAHCRTAILMAIAAQPGKTRDLLMIATDGVYFRTRPVGLDEGSELGQWEIAQKNNLTIVMPGVHYDDKARVEVATGASMSVRSRGIPAAAFAAALGRLDAGFRDLVVEPRDGSRWPVLDIPIKFQVTSPRLALHQNKWEKAGTVQRDVARQLSTDPKSKRVGPGSLLGAFLDEEPYLDGDIVRSYPYPGGGKDIQSTPYSKTFGGPVSDNDGLDATITPDGDLRQEWNQLTLGGSM